MSYLERYLSGEHEQVWAELMVLGHRVRERPLHADATGVVKETMMRARHNVELLVERLHQLSYDFVSPDSAWITPDDTIQARLGDIERENGELPMSLRSWFEIVGQVAFIGDHPQLSTYYNHDWDDPGSLGCYSDPLEVNLPRNGQLVFPYYEDRYGEDKPTNLHMIYIAADAAHKAGYSGGSPTGVVLPNPAIDAPLISDDWDGIPFVSYLRECFKWGGFPGLRHCSAGSRQSHERAELVAFLASNLFPI